MASTIYVAMASAVSTLVHCSPCICRNDRNASVSGRNTALVGLPVRRPRLWTQTMCSVTKEKEDKVGADIEETTRKYGLEAGLWKIFTTKNDGEEEPKDSKKNQAKDLLTRYGGAYLATSISLSAVSFTLCYLLISSGVDVADLLSKIGIQSNETGEKVGTFALAYAAHKAASPIRFPPTVALTPIVANWFGKKSNENKDAAP